MKRGMLLRGLGAVGLVVVAASCQATQGDVDEFANGGDTEQVAVAGVDIELNVLDTDEQGVPNFIVGQLGRVDIPNGATIDEIESLMYPALEVAAPMMRMNPEELVLQHAFTDPQGDQHFRFSQFKNGLVVLGGEAIVHVRGGVVYAVNGAVRGDRAAPIEAGIDIDGAILAVKQAQESIDELQIADEGEFAYRVGQDGLDLVYQIRVTGMRRDGLPVDDLVLVNAANGDILARMSQIHTAKNRELHNLNHGTSLPGATVRTEGQGATGESTVDTNYDLLGSVWDCYKNLFGRDSINGSGAKLISSVHYSNNYCNAFWNGTQMVYGDGNGSQCGNLALSMDVTAHELTHAVTQYESNLTYSGESGGLNESMSDVFGNVCEWYRDGQVVSNDTWLVGEDIWTPSTPGDALRYMNDPSKDGSSADHYADYYSGMDVHYSSGISNLAFYLLSQGGTHPRGQSSTSVTGIGIAKASQIFYRMNSVYLTSSSNFAAARTAAIQSATDLYGASSAEVTAAGKAWEAVGVGSSTPGGCGHDKCATGASLTNGCSSCVSSICAADSYCCNTYWDSICVGEVRTVCGSLTCAESNGSCSHGLCATGSALVNSCDSAKANCVAAICAVDSYCCNNSWDSICVGEVASVCGKNCN